MDRWDVPGLDNDTEMRVFTFVLVLSLVLLVSKLLATIQLMAPRLRSVGAFVLIGDPLFAEETHPASTSAFEAFSPPLRI
ncbi:MAG: hypothetical protein ACYCSN_02325 [Acidobacteriaceae bacterium]